MNIPKADTGNAKNHNRNVLASIIIEKMQDQYGRIGPDDFEVAWGVAEEIATMLPTYSRVVKRPEDVMPKELAENEADRRFWGAIIGIIVVIILYSIIGYIENPF